MGFMKTPDEDETSNLIWCDAAVQQEKITELQNYQVGMSHQQLLSGGTSHQFHPDFPYLAS